MTRHDPFAYGQVQFDGKKAPAVGDPDDILFADAGAPKGESSWGLLDADVDSLLPGAKPQSAMEFGSEVLGETMSPPPSPAPQVRPRPAVTPRPAVLAPAAPSSPPRRADTLRHEVGARSVTPATPHAEHDALLGHVGATVVEKAPSRAANRARKSAPPYVGRRRSRLPGVVVPLLLFAGGGMGSAWFYAMQQNVVMAGIVGMLTLVSAMFAAVLLRA